MLFAPVAIHLYSLAFLIRADKKRLSTFTAANNLVVHLFPHCKSRREPGLCVRLQPDGISEVFRTLPPACSISICLTFDAAEGSASQTDRSSVLQTSSCLCMSAVSYPPPFTSFPLEYPRRRGTGYQPELVRRQGMTYICFCGLYCVFLALLICFALCSLNCAINF